MTKQQIVLLVILVTIVGAFMLRDKPMEEVAEVGRNVEILESERNLPIVTEDVAYFPSANGYFARPESAGVYPGIVMIHENRGLRPETKMAAEQLAKEGYMVLAVDLLGGVAETQEEARALTANFVPEQGVENMREAVQFLRDRGAQKVASLGWCFGGRQSVALAISGEQLDATVVYYGGNMATTVEELTPIKWPVLGIFGDQDQGIPVEMVREFETSLDTLGVENEIHIYPGVGHAFANPSGMNYAPEQTEAAWEETLTFLEENL